jgi:hypothetical protein
MFSGFNGMADPGDYDKQHRNTYGESPHAARKAIRRGKQRQHQKERRTTNAALKHEDEQTVLEVAAKTHKGWDFKKSPDEPLGRVLIVSLCDRLVHGQLAVSTFRTRMQRLRQNYADFTAEYRSIYRRYSSTPRLASVDDAVREVLAEFA